MLVVNRFQVDPGDVDRFTTDAKAALTALAACRGFERGECGGSLDEPGTWVLVTAWDSVGSYRRALSSFDVKMYATPLLARALPEASAFEVNLSVVDGSIVDHGSDRAAADNGRVRD